jgi:iron complex outermembrane receptor protein
MTHANRWIFLAAMAVGMPVLGSAQTGSIAGKVTDSTRAQALSGAQITVRDPAGRTAGTAVTAAGGTYRVDNLAAGKYSVLISLIPFGPKRFDAVTVTAGSATTLDARLVAQAYTLAEVRVSTVSRVPEKITEAPATISVIPAVQVQEHPALSVTDHLQSVPGVAISQGGLVQSNVVARGFNNIFSGALLTLIDNRYASVPSLRVNVPAFFPVTNDDIEQVEFVLGPGAALYGPNAASGVLHIITKSPINSPGTTVSLEGGVRSGSPSDPTGLDGSAGLYRFGFRHATRVSEKLGFKISGEYLKGTDWKYADRNAQGRAIDSLSPSGTAGLKASCGGATFGCRDFNLEKWNGEARIDVRPDRNTEWITSYGITKAVNLIELTGVGAGQAHNWQYQYLQTRFRHKELFVQVFGNFSNAGNDEGCGTAGHSPCTGTYLLRDGSPIVDKSRLWAAQAQHGFAIGSKETVIYGADFIYTDARTGGTINGANENNDTIKEIGGYVHSVTRLSPKVDLVAALRVDKHNRLPSAVWSPRVGFVFKPNDENNLRLTYNRAFSTPTNNDLFLDLPAGQAGPYTVRALGVPASGFHFRANGGCSGGVDNLCMRAIPLPGVPTQLLPANADILWQVAVGIMAASPLVPGPLKAALAAVQAPTTEVGTQLRVLNANTGTFRAIEGTQVRDIETLKPSISNTFEVGYKGNLAHKVRLTVDGFYERRENFVGPLIVESPNVFFDPTTLAAYLVAGLTPILGSAQAAQQAAAALVPGMAAIPLGTVVPNQGGGLTDRPDIFLTYRNFGAVDIYGADVAVDYIIDDRWSLAATYSWVNKDFFTAAEVNGPTDIALNASKSRGSASVRFRNDRRGWATELRVRAAKGFPVNSGVYVSAQRADGSFIPTDDYGVVDVQASWRPPFGTRNMLITATVNNVLDHAYATFVGVPKLGRLLLTKVSYTF